MTELELEAFLAVVRTGSITAAARSLYVTQPALSRRIRALEEELGIPTASITVLGRLDFVAHRANFIMYPVLARVETAAAERMVLNPAEVDHTFLVPLEHIVHNPPLEYSYALEPRPPADFPYQLIGIPRGYRWQQGRETVPVYLWQGHAIWGLTGRITRHLAGLLGGEMG